MVAMSYSFVTIVSIFLIFGAACGIIYRVGTLRLHITEDIMYERTIDGHMLREMLAGGLANLKANADEINDLNVFPIPDGDTGDNMVSTLSGGLRAVGDCDGGIGEVAERLSGGMVLGARGNSGVILSQMFAGIACGLSGKVYADVGALGAAFARGVEYSYASLSDPVEGTILTVMRRATEHANGRITENSTPAGYISDYLEEGGRALEDTPSLLPVLKEAGTVDSGGAGLLALMHGFADVLAGRRPAEDRGAEAAERSAPDISLFTEDSELTLGYCTEFLLRLTNNKTDISAFSIEDFRSRLSGIGNSVVAFRTGTIVKAHVHVMQPWRALEFAQRYGEFLTVKIENMNIQHSEREERRAEPSFRRRGVRKPYGVVAVACGEGMCKVFEELGADVVIDEEKYGNPSVETLVKAVEAVNAENVFLLPDNANVLMGAQEAASMCGGCKVTVIPTRDCGSGYVALTALDCGSGDDGEIAAAMDEAVEAASCGAVARAVRDADMNGVSVSAGQYIAVSGKNILLAADNKADAAAGLVRSLHGERRDFIVVFCGSGVSKEERAECRERFAAEFPSAEYYEVEGGQSTYDFIIVLQ